MKNKINIGALLAAFLLSIFVYALYGAFFAWGLQYPLENILDRDIRYWDLFLVSTLAIVFLTNNPVRVE